MSEDGLIELSSPAGQQLLAQVQSGSDSGSEQSNLIKVFSKQSGSKNCGIQSSALIWAAAYVSKRSTHLKDIDLADIPYTEMKLLQMPAIRKYITEEHIAQHGGISLVDLYNILTSLGHRVDLVHAALSSVDVFREAARSSLSCPSHDTAVIVNYQMSILGQTPTYGHHSPLAAYHEGTDRFLIMDTWYETHECWAKTESLFKAMNTIDSASGESRGFCVVTKFTGIESD